MEVGDWLRIRSNGFTFMAKLIDENNNFYAVEPIAMILPKKEIDQMEELPPETVKESSLRTVSVGRKSYLGQTTPFPVKSLEIQEEH